MELYILFILIFSISSIIGVPVLSYVQYIFIHGMTIKDWIEGLPITVAVVFALILIISLIMNVLMQPIIKSYKLSKVQKLTQAEKLRFSKIFTYMDTASSIILAFGYIVGNGFLILLKVKKGIFTLGNSKIESIITIFMLFGLCITYFFIARAYCVHLFNSMAQKYLVNIHKYHLL